MTTAQEEKLGAAFQSAPSKTEDVESLDTDLAEETAELDGKAKPEGAAKASEKVETDADTLETLKAKNEKLEKDIQRLKSIEGTVKRRQKQDSLLSDMQHQLLRQGKMIEALIKGQGKESEEVEAMTKGLGQELEQLEGQALARRIKEVDSEVGQLYAKAGKDPNDDRVLVRLFLAAKKTGDPEDFEAVLEQAHEALSAVQSSATPQKKETPGKEKPRVNPKDLNTETGPSGGSGALGASAYKEALKSGKPLPSKEDIDRMTAKYLAVH